MGMGLTSFGPEDYTAGPAQDQQQWKSVGSGPQMLAAGSHRGDSYAPLRVLLSHLPVKRHLVCKRWTIEKADENSNDTPWFALHRPNSDKLRFHLPSLP